MAASMIKRGILYGLLGPVLFHLWAAMRSAMR